MGCTKKIINTLWVKYIAGLYKPQYKLEKFILAICTTYNVKGAETIPNDNIF